MTIVSETIQWLIEHSIEFSDAMSPSELAAIESEYGFQFGPDHRELLLTAVPIGGNWMDWRGSTDDAIRSQLGWPLEGMLFDVENNVFWPPSWGPKPEDMEEAIRVASIQFLAWPTLVPLYSHRYMPAAPSETGAPVFSVYQTDVVYLGQNLLSYVKTEFAREPQTARDADYLPPWSLLACWVDVP